MPYKITKTSGAEITTIPDGSVDATSTSLTLIGKNFAGYGSFLNENYVRLLENFSNVTAPANALEGQIWYDNLNGSLKHYTGSQWKTIASSSASASQPASPVLGDMWWDTRNAQLKVYSGTAWVTVGPTYSSSSGTTGALVDRIVDTNGIEHSVVKFYVSDDVIAIVSDAGSTGFTPATEIAGFEKIYPGLNLIGSGTLANAKFYGTALNSDTLQGLPPSAFFLANSAITTNFPVTTTELNVNSDLTLQSAAGVAKITNNTQDKDLELYVSPGGVDYKALTIAGNTGVVTLANALPLGSGGTGATNASGARTSLGLGNLAVLNNGQYGNIAVSGVNSQTWTVNAASTSQAGIVLLASNASVFANTTLSSTIAVTPLALQARLETITSGLLQIATQAETIAGTETTKAVSPANLQAKTASTSALGIVQLATSAEANAGVSTSKVVTPSALNSRIATISQTGLIEIATSAEVNAGIDTDRAVTPANLAARTASTSLTGLVALATSAEVIAGTDTAKAVTSANLATLTSTITRAGLLRTATSSETNGGIITNAAVTPANLSAYFGFARATTSTAGTAILANTAQASATTESANVLTPSSLSAGFSSAGVTQQRNAYGYQVLPGGIILQWGANTFTTSSTITFPRAFTTACYNVTTTMNGTGTSYVTSISTTQVAITQSSGVSRTIYWQAIGF